MFGWESVMFEEDRPRRDDGEDRKYSLLDLALAAVLVATEKR
jgi:hypothetical protein